MVKVGGKRFMFNVLRVPWAILCFVGRVLRHFFLAVGVFVVLGFLGYAGFEFIIGMNSFHESISGAVRPVFRGEPAGRILRANSAGAGVASRRRASASPTTTRPTRRSP